MNVCVYKYVFPILLNTIPIITKRVRSELVQVFFNVRLTFFWNVCGTLIRIESSNSCMETSEQGPASLLNNHQTSDCRKSPGYPYYLGRWSIWPLYLKS